MNRDSRCIGVCIGCCLSWISYQKKSSILNAQQSLLARSMLMTLLTTAHLPFHQETHPVFSVLPHRTPSLTPPPPLISHFLAYVLPRDERAQGLSAFLSAWSAFSAAGTDGRKDPRCTIFSLHRSPTTKQDDGDRRVKRNQCDCRVTTCKTRVLIGAIERPSVRLSDFIHYSPVMAILHKASFNIQHTCINARIKTILVILW